MSETAARRKLKGNVLQYLYLAQRRPRIFLQRNLNAVLDAHERRLRTQNLTTNDILEPDEAMIANERRSAGWDFPTPELLSDLVHNQNPELHIDGLEIRPLKVHNTVRPSVARSETEEQSLLDWLPNPDQGLALPCQVIVRLCHKRVIYSGVSQATIRQAQDSGAGDKFTVELKERFLIDLPAFFTTEEAGSNGFRSWKRTVTLGYSLEVEVSCLNSADSAELLSRLEGRHVDHYMGKPANEGTIRATWEELPKCPPIGHLLPLKRAAGHRSLKLDYGLDLSIGWKKRRPDSVLKRYNRLREVKSQPLPTPSSSDMQEPVMRPQYLVRYISGNGTNDQAFTVSGLKCIFCASATRDGQSEMYASRSALKKPSQGVNRLLLHYWACHDAIDCEREETVVKDGKILVSLRMRLKEKSGSASVGEERYNGKKPYEWIAPDRPFDIEAHVAGNEKWVGGKGRSGRLPAPKLQDRQREPTQEPSVPIHSTSAAPTPISKANFDSFAEVPELPPAKRRKFRVPDVPDVTFYRSSTKQPILPGAELSESDDELQDDRVITVQRRKFIEEGLMLGARQFHEAFNRHLDSEQTASKRLTRDAIVRFARKHRGELRDREWIGAYEARIKHLCEHRIIGEDLVAYCLEEMAPIVVEVGIRQNVEEAQPAQPQRTVGEEPDSGGRPPMASTPKAAESEMEDEPQSRAQDDAHSRIRVNGRFATQDREESETQETEEPQKVRKKKKPHRWSGGGADRDIIAQGQEQLANGTRPKSAVQERSTSKAHTGAAESWHKTSKQRSTHTPGSPNVPPPRTLAPSTFAPSNEPSSKSAFTQPRMKRRDGQDDPASPLPVRHKPSIGNLKFVLKNPEHPYQSIHTASWQFIKEGVHETTASVDDVSFDKLIQYASEVAMYVNTLHVLVWKGEHNDHVVSNDETLHGVLREWLASTVYSYKQDLTIYRKDQLPELRIPPSGAEMSQSQSKIETVSGVCICGKPARPGKGCVACENLGCERQHFHLACVGLDSRTPGFRCPACAVTTGGGGS